MVRRYFRRSESQPGRHAQEFQALENVSFDVARGETVGIVGRNGSGKSTLLQILCGTLPPTAGQVDIGGRVAALLELGAGFNPEFTGRENVFLNGSLMGRSTAETEASFPAIAAFADIGAFIDQPVKTYSSGMHVRLAFAAAINVDPDILIVDEALSVGDEAFQRKCFVRIEDIKRHGDAECASGTDGSGERRVRARDRGRPVTRMLALDSEHPRRARMPRAQRARASPSRRACRPQASPDAFSQEFIVLTSTPVQGQGDSRRSGGGRLCRGPVLGEQTVRRAPLIRWRTAHGRLAPLGRGCASRGAGGDHMTRTRSRLVRLAGLTMAVCFGVLATRTLVPSRPDRSSSAKTLSRATAATGAAGATPASSTAAVEAVTRARVEKAYGQLPMAFEANAGQTNAAVDFLARGQGYTVFLTEGGGATLSLATGSVSTDRTHRPECLTIGDSPAKFPAPLAGCDEAEDAPALRSATLRLALVGGSATSRGAGGEALPGKVNYFTGGHPANWRTSIATFSRVTFPEVYPGIDIAYYGNQQQLEYDFIVKPGADPEQVRLRFDGADALSVDDQSGDLEIRLGGHTVTQRAPVVYQEIGSERRIVEGGYEVREDEVVFRLARYDAARPLVIDPVLVYATYLGGSVVSAQTEGRAIAVDHTGVFVTGSTERNRPTHRWRLRHHRERARRIRDEAGLVRRLSPVQHLSRRVERRTWLRHRGGWEWQCLCGGPHPVFRLSSYDWRLRRQLQQWRRLRDEASANRERAGLQHLFGWRLV